MNAILWLSLLVLALASYFSAIVLSMMRVSRSALEARLIVTGRQRQAEWLVAHAEDVQLAVALIRTLLRLSFFALVLVEIVGVGEAVRFRYVDLIWAGLISVVILWISSTVIATALARYAGAGLIVTALPWVRVLTTVLYPFTRAGSLIDEAVRRLSGANLREVKVEAELLRSIEESHREGGLDERSAALLENVVEFSSTDVGEVMTPRTDIDGIELTDDLSVIRSFIAKVGHSRIPVYRESLDNIVGVLYVKDLVPYLGAEVSDFRLEPILRQPNVVPETRPVRELLADFQKSEVHLAIVIDEYGGTAGLVTIEDVLEEIVGEIHDEYDPGEAEEPTLLTFEDGRAEVDGRFHIDDLNERLGLELPEDQEYDTVGGFMLASLGHVPEVGESFESHQARFTALAATQTHVQRIGVEILEPALGNGERARKSDNS